ncbi:MAG: ATPase component BioM of energizing module of biotin ECF transporter [uncultured Sulfurovum sp.]|uniref:ATPase component BioM of energizing module of biotin ECF transporter n=1 Tax=uncultured Sulfurovum sp. TaxID=269237 RepID=A0A6S6SJP5_9BACT|nr:MAG: ATPase component BioM of energizing module of biotin ECF transporter [uncultured Sulfurovum sp.]
MEKALISHNKHWKNEKYEELFHRDIAFKLIQQIGYKEIEVLQGIRRSGKSTIFKLLINHLMEEVDAGSILYVNLDDPYFSELWSNPKKLYALLELSEKINGVNPKYIFFDEIQNVEMWEKFIKAIYDNELVQKIYLTGSNASLLSSDYAVSLSGRYLKTIVYPLSLNEIYQIEKIESYFELLDNTPKVLNIIDHMMEFGSFAEVYKKEESEHKRELILNYYEIIILKDCVANHGIREVKQFKELTQYLISNGASLYAYSTISKALGINENSIKNYIYALEDAYLYHELKQFSYSLKGQVRSKKKGYLVDNGFLGNISFRFSNNRGKLFENLVYSELQKRGYEIFIFNDGSFECDFLVKKENELMAVQVCYELHSGNQERELKGLREIEKKFKVAKKLLLTYNQEEKVESIEVLPFWKYFWSNK